MKGLHTLPEPMVVGTIHSAGALRCALRLEPGQVDLLELRVDSFADAPEKLWRAIPRLPAPLLLTVRHPREGAAQVLSVAERRRLFRQFLPLVQWMDVEARSVRSLQAEIAYAVTMGVRLVVSDHDFRATPGVERMEERFALAQAAGAEVFKLAATLRSPGDLERMLGFLNRHEPGSIAAMGMGPLGKVSRLVLGACGSVLNYGYLDRPQVPGQWEATCLKERLRELRGPALV
ncbi:MAG: Catabolic 3-dehydroquinate dehydratase [Verrucomicrobiota bacterium]|jgi:3-dehydroquinate dehydratase-1